MSIAHSDAAKGILKVLGAPGNWVTRSFLFNAVDYHKKNETTFGQSLHELLQGGLVEENRIKLRPTQYARTEKPMPSSAPAPKPAAKAPGTEWPAHRPGAKPVPRTFSKVTARRAEIMKRMQASGETHFTVDDVRDFGVHGSVVSNIYTDLGALCADGRLVKIEGGRPITWKFPGKPVGAITSPAAAAPAAAARAPETTAAPAGAADLHPELQAIELKDWLEMEAVLQSATYRAQDAYDSYIAATCDQPTLNALRDSIDKTRTALTMHKARRPA